MSRLYGLLLAGGESRRMGRDKAALEYDGRPQLLAAWSLLSSRVEAAWLSRRPEQRDEPLRAALPAIEDAPGLRGPAAGILAALQAEPQAAWLVLACDLPHAGAATLDALLAGRDPAALATAFRSEHDGLPEPLCAVWEPAAREPLAAFVAGGRHCPRRFLRERPCRLLPVPVPGALDNVNTPEDYRAATGNRR